MTGGLQEVNVGALCFHYPGYIVHELGHTLGLWHEHVRPDRDKFIEILWENIMTDKEYNFNIEPRRYIQSFSSDYDYGSIMHYSLNAFSKNGKPTMKPKRAYTGTIGQRNAPTDSDYLQLRYLYGCQKCESYWGVDIPLTFNFLLLLINYAMRNSYFSYQSKCLNLSLCSDPRLMSSNLFLLCLVRGMFKIFD